MHPDLFDDTLEKKIHRMEKWMSRIQRQVFIFREEVRLLKACQEVSREKKKDKIIQLEFFTG